jgi:hypothetical protein
MKISIGIANRECEQQFLEPLTTAGISEPWTSPSSAEMQAFYPSKRAVEYRRQARLCFEQSEQVVTPEARAIFADLAFHWTRLAEQSERANAWPVSEMPDATVLIMRPRTSR